MYGRNPSDVVSHDVAQRCSYTRWASREILCDRNYMEVCCFTLLLLLSPTLCPVMKIKPVSPFQVSHYMAPLDAQVDTKGQAQEDPKGNAVPDVRISAFKCWLAPFCNSSVEIASFFFFSPLPFRPLVLHMVSGR